MPDHQRNLANAERRSLRFTSIPSAIHEAERLAEADAAGRLRATGNWTLGQTLAHLAWWANDAFDRHPFPPYLRVFFMLVGRFTKRKALRGDVRPGLRLPGVVGGTFGTDPRPTDEALASMKSAFQRLDRECPTKPDPGFGRLTHDEWRTLHLRHAEHHLSYFHPVPDEAADRDPPASRARPA